MVLSVSKGPGDAVIAQGGGKRCAKCGQVKVLKYFGKDRKRKDGLQVWCIPCRRAYAVARHDGGKCPTCPFRKRPVLTNTDGSV